MALDHNPGICRPLDTRVRGYDDGASADLFATLVGQAQTAVAFALAISSSLYL